MDPMDGQGSDLGQVEAGNVAGKNVPPQALVEMADGTFGVQGDVLNTKTRLGSQPIPETASGVLNFILIFLRILRITGTMDEVLHELGYRNIGELVSKFGELHDKSIILKEQQSHIPGLGYLTGQYEQDRLEDIHQNWVWSMKTYAFFDALAGDPNSPKNKELLEERMGLLAGTALKISDADNQTLIPYWVAADHNSKRILCVIRGTRTKNDWLIDAGAQTLVIKTGVGAHSAMTAVAKSIVGDAADTIIEFANANPGYTLHFCGHSLGAGVCGIASYLVHERLESGAKLSSLAESVTGACIAPPPVLTMNAASTMGYVYSLRNQIDVVPTASLANFICFVKAVQAIVLPNAMGGDGLPPEIALYIKQAISGLDPAKEPKAHNAVIDTEADSVPLDYKVGTRGIWPMYAPGALNQVKKDNRVLTAKDHEERWHIIVLNDDMISDHIAEPNPHIRNPQ